MYDLLELIRNDKGIKNVLIALIIVVILTLSYTFIFRNIIFKNVVTNQYEKLKIDKKQGFVYDNKKYKTDNDSIPYLNIDIPNLDEVNEAFVTDYIFFKSYDENIYTYVYNMSSNYLSVMSIKSKDVDFEGVSFSFKSAIIDVNKPVELTEEEILNKFSLSKENVINKIEENYENIYKKLIIEGLVKRNECDYDCFYDNALEKTYLDNPSYYIEENKLYAYLPFDIYNESDSELNFDYKDFAIVIKEIEK